MATESTEAQKTRKTGEVGSYVMSEASTMDARTLLGDRTDLLPTVYANEIQADDLSIKSRRVGQKVLLGLLLEKRKSSCDDDDEAAGDQSVMFNDILAAFNKLFLEGEEGFEKDVLAKMLSKGDKYYLGEIYSDQPLVGTNSANKPTSLKIISAVDLRKIEQSISKEDPSKSYQEILFENKRNLHVKSQSRIQNWKQTIAGQRLAREERRVQQKLKEEKRRKDVDEGFQADADARRAAAVERARRMKYLESDEVKSFHSHLNHLQVLEEREMQLKLKKERMNAEALADKALVNAALEKCKEQEKEEVQIQLLNRLQRVQLAQVHIAQAKGRKLYEYDEKKSLFDYGRKLAMEDKAYNEEQKNLALKKRKEELHRKEILDQMRSEAIERKVMEKQEAEEDERITKAWAAHQEYKMMIKQKVEDDWKMKLFRIRTQIGENIHKQAIDATEKEREIREQQELEAEKKAKEEAERKALKKMQNHKELKEFQQLHQERKMAQKQKEIEEGKEALVKFKLDALAYQQEMQAKKEKIKKAENEITHYNRAQSARRHDTRQAERQDALKDTQIQHQIDQERQEMLTEYIKSIGSEPWAANSYRVTGYIASQLKDVEKSTLRGKSASPRRHRDSYAETHARIGFAGSSYAAIDLVGTNEICRGSAAQLGIEGSSVALASRS